MPVLISRAEALQRIVEEGGKPACLMCAINARRVGAVYAVHEDDAFLVMLPRYVRKWGHVLVTPKAHVTTFSDVDPALWTATSLLALKAARVVEAVLRPRRCYVASTGSSGGELTQSSMHVHVHVVPLYESEDRPAEVFSWSAGVYTAEHDEWSELQGRMIAGWNADTR